MNELEPAKRDQLLALFREGVGVRKAALIVGCHRDTAMRLRRKWKAEQVLLCPPAAIPAMRLDDQVRANERAKSFGGILTDRLNDVGSVIGDAEMPGCVLVQWRNGDVYSVNKCWLEIIGNGGDPLGR